MPSLPEALSGIGTTGPPAGHGGGRAPFAVAGGLAMVAGVAAGAVALRLGRRPFAAFGMGGAGLGMGGILLAIGLTGSGSTPGYEVIRTTALATAGALNKAIAPCSAGRVALGGGVDYSGEQRVVNTIAADQTGSPDGWQAATVSRDTKDATLTAYAVCAKPTALGYEVVRTTAAAAPGAIGRAIAQCPAGKVALGGGVDYSGDQELVDTLPAYKDGSADGWTVDTASHDTKDATVTAYAVCAKPIAVGYEVVRTTALAAPGGLSVAVARCPAGKVALGGGVDYSGSQQLVNTLPAYKGGRAESWQVSTFSRDTKEATVTAYAMCAKQSALD